MDIGAEKTTGLKELRAGFKVPSLRNITKSAPYFHSGKFSTLREVVKFYTSGRGHAVSAKDDLILHWHIWEPDLSDEEIDRVVDFLYTLEDEYFLPKTPNCVPSGLELWQAPEANTVIVENRSTVEKNTTSTTQTEPTNQNNKTIKANQASDPLAANGGH
ncbi:hypothetical protein [Nitrosomonas sp.]|uniref:hypothetical protein n=1 Tax=Nitrosomonas sp. TaxID=42353 RepID=UPI001DCD38CF|nr:hypothetical protein [Nitrosomonas sp.]MCB1949873.1 hypothetical protein [Nitrosomonas sp.]